MNNVHSGIKDILSGLASVRIWHVLAWNEIKQRYRRSKIGPFWLTISTGIMIVAMGPLYAKLFNQELEKYFLYLAASIITWELILITINDSCNGFISNEGLIKNISLPLSLYIFKIVWKNIIVFFHNFIIIVLVMLFYNNELHNLKDLALLGMGFFLWILNSFWICMLIAMLCSRYRDFTPIVNSAMGVIFFITPILWKSSMVGENNKFVIYNPFYNLIQIIRSPILGGEYSLFPYYYSISLGFLGFIFLLIIFNKFRNSIVFWV